MLSLGNFYSGQTYFPDVLQRRRKEDLLFVKAVSQERLGCTQDLEPRGWGRGLGCTRDLEAGVAD